MSRAKLDRTRQFGTVHGTGSPYAYEQDGLQFDSTGYEYIDPAAPQPASEPRVDPFGLKELAASPPPIESQPATSESEADPRNPAADDDDKSDGGDGLDALKMKALRAVYFDLTEKLVPVGVSAQKLREMIRQIRDERGGTNEEADEGISKDSDGVVA